jgi:biopolymer transport protein ExbD
MASEAAKKGDGSEAFEINLTPMIDVVFQLIIFFMCAMKFKTLEKKIEAFLPKDRGLAKTPEKIEEKVQIKVIIKQGDTEGVPHFIMFDQDIRSDLGPGVPRMKSPPVKGTGEDMKRYNDEVEQHWAQYIQPKINEIKKQIDQYLAEDPTLPCQIDAGHLVRHEYVIAVLDAFIEVCQSKNIENPEITFVGTPAPRPGS